MMPNKTLTVGDERFFSRDAMIWQVDREMVLLLAGGRALLMQLAHPKVAAGVAGHSHFKADPLGRLYRTMGAMWSIVFDDAPKARASLEQVKNVHRRIHGIISPAESVPLGTPYDALDVNFCCGYTPRSSTQRWWLMIFSSSGSRPMKRLAITMTLRISLTYSKFQK